MTLTPIILVCAGLACLQVHDADPRPADTEEHCAERLTALRQSLPDHLTQIFGVEVKKYRAAGLCRDEDAPVMGTPRGEFSHVHDLRESAPEPLTDEERSQRCMIALHLLGEDGHLPGLYEAMARAGREYCIMKNAHALIDAIMWARRDEADY